MGAAAGAGRSGLRTRSVHSELLLCLAAGRSIDAALGKLGIQEGTTTALLCSFEGATPVAAAADLLLSDPPHSPDNSLGDSPGALPVAMTWAEVEASARERPQRFTK